MEKELSDLEVKSIEEFAAYCTTGNFSAPPHEIGLICDWWLSKMEDAYKLGQDHQKDADINMNYE